jgi:hypothetical protein
MDKKLQKKLLHKFQFLYVKNGLESTYTSMYQEIECGNGWFNLLWQLCDKIEKVLNTESKEFQNNFAVTQVKEKFGRLRFYSTLQNDLIDKLIDKASIESIETCEMCGKSGKLRKKHVWQTLCDKCS